MEYNAIKTTANGVSILCQFPLQYKDESAANNETEVGSSTHENNSNAVARIGRKEVS
jgi:hypothetical protein